MGHVAYLYARHVEAHCDKWVSLLDECLKWLCCGLDGHVCESLVIMWNENHQAQTMYVGKSSCTHVIVCIIEMHRVPRLFVGGKSQTNCLVGNLPYQCNIKL